MLSIKNLLFFSIVLSLSKTTAHAQSVKPYTNSVGMKMAAIKPGSFSMGEMNPKFQLGKVTVYSKDAPYYDETPVHPVTITYPFYISETEVTIEQYRRFKKEYKDTSAYAPYVAGISWNDAMAYCKWLSKKEGKTYRLPTEAEWEFTCRAGT